MTDNHYINFFDPGFRFDDPETITAAVLATSHPHIELIQDQMVRHLHLHTMLHIQGLGESPAHTQCLEQMEYWDRAIEIAKVGAWC